MNRKLVPIVDSLCLQTDLTFILSVIGDIHVFAQVSMPLVSFSLSLSLSLSLFSAITIMQLAVSGNRPLTKLCWLM